jgi:tetratricopeptide (TPR) repeat protein
MKTLLFLLSALSIILCVSCGVKISPDEYEDDSLKNPVKLEMNDTFKRTMHSLKKSFDKDYFIMSAEKKGTIHIKIESPINIAIGLYTPDMEYFSAPYIDLVDDFPFTYVKEGFHGLSADIKAGLTYYLIVEPYSGNAGAYKLTCVFSEYQYTSDVITIVNKNYDATNNYGHYNSEISNKNARNALEQGMNFYNQNEYEEAIDSYISACKSENAILAYYHLGICLMDIKEYELSKASFEKAIYMFESDDYYPNYSEYYMEDLFTYDTNGIKSELYFSYYNIACIESLQNNLDSAYEYLCEAFYHGYPYINHIRQDEDLRNLFIDRSRLQSIEAIYNAGSQNTIAGKRFDMNIPAGFIQLIYFQDENYLRDVVYHQDGRNAGDAHYEIKNYMVFSNVLSSSAYGKSRFKYIRQFEGSDRSGNNFTELTDEEMEKYDKRYDFLDHE